MYSVLALCVELTDVNKTSACRTGAEYAIKIHTADTVGLQSGARSSALLLG